MEKVYVNNSTTAAVVIDCQKGFSELCPNELPVKGALEIVPEIQKVLSMVKIKVGSKDAHNPKDIWVADEKHPQIVTKVEGTDQADCYWNSHCNVGEKGFELLDGLPEPKDFDFFIWKGIEAHPYSAAYHLLNPNKNGNKMTTGLIEYLRSKGITTIIVLGLATNFCVRATVYDLKEAGFEIIVDLAGCRGIDYPVGAVDECVEQMRKDGIKIVKNYEGIEFLPWG